LKKARIKLQLLKNRKRGKVPQKQQKWQNKTRQWVKLWHQRGMLALFNILEVSDVLAVSTL